MSKHRYDRRAQRNVDAVARQAARDSRTDEQQLRLVQTRQGNSAKEVKRIVARQK